jgi:hypothetical protein
VQKQLTCKGILCRIQNVPIICLFCGDYAEEDTSHQRSVPFRYICNRCGYVSLEEEAADDFAAEKFSENDKTAISLTLRNNWEETGRKTTGKELTLNDLHQIASQFKPLTPVEKMDYALIRFERLSRYVGADVTTDSLKDYPLYWCKSSNEFESICRLLVDSGFVKTLPKMVSITAEGYQRLRKIQKPNKMSRQCFVAMWFNDGMKDVYNVAIKPAIEYKENGETEPRYKAVRIDNVEHVNDINDEIIAQIRRSRFMVCDLTGYRGGVYFEAGFAYGLGLEVIYTCRKDWSKEEVLKDGSKKIVEFLFDSKGRKIPVKKEGVHFDLAHRNRIEWEPDKLDEFKIRLETRIKSLFFD